MWNRIKAFFALVLGRLGTVLALKTRGEGINSTPTPQTQEKPKEKLVDTPTPQDPILDYIAKLPAPHKCLTQEDAIARYGKIVEGKWADEGKWCSLLEIPADLAVWINTATGKPATRIYCNKDIQAPLIRALYALKRKNLLLELKTFDGCFMIRDVRGVPGKLSCHAYALAVDLNAKENGLGEEPKLSADFVTCFLLEGFNWGGVFDRKDGMHFSHAWEGND